MLLQNLNISDHIEMSATSRCILPSKPPIIDYDQHISPRISEKKLKMKQEQSTINIIPPV